MAASPDDGFAASVRHPLCEGLVAILSIGLVALTLYSAFYGVFPGGIQRSAHLLLILLIVFVIGLGNVLATPVRGARGVLEIGWSVLAMAVAVVAAGHHIVNFDAINGRYGAITPSEIWLAAALIAVIFDACRRTIGWAIVLLAAAFLAYALLGAYLPAPVGHRGYSLQRVASQIYLGGGGIFGTPLGVSATFVTAVVVLGALLEKTGGGQVMMDFAIALTGRMRGGPAKAAIVGSSLMGTISGTAVANVLTTGPISIPLMRKSGYSREAAGAIEAVASTGGQLMPPVMGAAAFIMADFTNTSYLTIARAAFLPAIIFYAVLFAMVHFEAVRRRIPPMREIGSATDWPSILRASYLLLPLPVFVAMLLGGYSIMLAAFWAIVASVLVSYAAAASAMTPHRIVDVCVAAASAVVPVAMACAAAGMIIGVITLTGVGLKFSTLVVALSGGMLPVALVLTMLTCLVLGMGLPTAAAYILVATLVAPALVDMGVGLIAAHLFVLYSAMLSSITPPVALAAYAAASIAGANPLKIAVVACQFGIAAFGVPYFFVYDPTILQIDASPGQIALAFVTAIAGGICISAAIIGFLLGHLRLVERLILGGCALLFISSDWQTDLVATAALAVVVVLHRRAMALQGASRNHHGETTQEITDKGD